MFWSSPFDRLAYLFAGRSVEYVIWQEGKPNEYKRTNSWWFCQLLCLWWGLRYLLGGRITVWARGSAHKVGDKELAGIVRTLDRWRIADAA